MTVVEELLSNQPFLMIALEDGIINYSALARKLMPSIKHRLSKDFTEEAVIMALKRLRLKALRGMDERVHCAIERAHYSIHSPIYDVVFEYGSEEIREVAEKCLAGGALFMLIIGTRTASLVTDSLDIAHRAQHILSNKCSGIKKDLAMFRVMLNKEDVDAPGIIYFLTRLLTQHGVSIVELGSSYQEISFVIKEHDVRVVVDSFLSMKRTPLKNDRSTKRYD